MSSIENSEEVGRNKTKNRSKWYRIKRLCQTYPLGAIGSFIVFLVVFAAVFAADCSAKLVTFSNVEPRRDSSGAILKVGATAEPPL